MTLEKELEIYWKMFWAFFLGIFFGWREIDTTWLGYCSWLDCHRYRLSLRQLSVLYSLKPNEGYGMYWFRPGDRISRVRLLWKVIKLTEQKIKERNEDTIHKASPGS